MVSIKAVGRILTLLMSCSVFFAQASTIVSNLNNSTIGPVGDNYIAVKFTMGGANLYLTDVVGPMGSFDTSLSDLAIYTDNNGNPGTILYDLGSQAALNTNVNMWIASGTDLLSANVSYWVVLENTADEVDGWGATHAPASSGSGTIDELSLSSNGSSWSAVTSLNGLIEVDGSAAPAAVPEPKTLYLLAVATVVGLGLGTRWRVGAASNR